MPAGVLPGQQHRGVAHGLGRLDHLRRDLETAAAGLPALGQHHPRRAEAVHRDVVGPQVGGEPEVQPLGGGLGHPVGVRALVDHVDPGGRDRDQRAAAARPHVRDDGLGHQEHPGEVDVQAQLPALQRRGLDWAEPQHAGVGDQDVDAAELRNRRVDRGVDRLLAGDVARHRQRPPARGGDGVGDRPMVPGSLPCCSERAATATDAPARGSAVAIVAPMPRLAPATNAILPARRHCGHFGGNRSAPSRRMISPLR